MRQIILLLFLSIFVLRTHAQYQNADKQIKAMEKLSFLEGEWSGSGWMMSRSGEKEEFIQTESISFKTGGTTLLIEGKGKEPETNRTVHDALAIVYYDTESDEYVFNSHVMQGYHGSYKGMAAQDTFIWIIENPYAGKMTYTITLNEDGNWFETGIRTNTEGKKIQFFEMTLSRKEK